MFKMYCKNVELLFAKKMNILDMRRFFFNKKTGQKFILEDDQSFNRKLLERRIFENIDSIRKQKYTSYHHCNRKINLKPILLKPDLSLSEHLHAISYYIHNFQTDHKTRKPTCWCTIPYSIRLLAFNACMDKTWEKFCLRATESQPKELPKLRQVRITLSEPRDVFTELKNHCYHFDNRRSYFDRHEKYYKRSEAYLRNPDAYNR